MMFFYYILSVWGATHILVASKITDGVRDWMLINSPKLGYLLNCYQCTSFWVSMILYNMFNFSLPLNDIDLYFFKVNPGFLIFSFIGSGIVSFISVILSLLITISKK